MNRARIAACLLAFAAGCGKGPSEPVDPGPEREETPPEPEPGPLDPEDWITPAEASGFEATPTYDETIAWLRRLEAAVPWMKVETFGTSAQGRDMVYVVASGDGAFTPDEAARTGLPVVMIQNGIHPGEVDGKDACLMILGDMALGDLDWILDQVILVIVPVYNVDGHERISKYNRPNQDGPVRGMGFRTTAAGLDLNRDSLEVVTPEARALTGLIDRWRPHMHVDDHVTNGSDHAWVFMWSYPEAPQLAAPVDAWMREHMDEVLAEAEEAGHPNGPYVWLKDGKDPAQGFYTTLRAPRFASSCMALRNRPSILVETHSYKPFEKRVLANRDFLVALVRQVGAHGASLVEAVSEAEAHTTALGAPGAEPSDIVLSWKVVEPPDTYLWPVYAHHLETSVVTGEPLLVYDRGTVDAMEVPWYHRVEPDVTVPRPRGYLVLAGWPQIEERLEAHGLRVERLAEDLEVEVETIRISNPRYEPQTYQGRIRVSVDVARAPEKRLLPAGTLWIPADQPDFEVAVQLLEPEAPDSLVSWGFMGMVMERKTWIGERTLEKLVSEMLGYPETAAEWEEALEDPALAKDPKARALWWYERTPYWDETVGLMPVMRLMEAAEMQTEPWP